MVGDDAGLGRLRLARMLERDAMQQPSLRLPRASIVEFIAIVTAGESSSRHSRVCVQIRTPRTGNLTPS
jgi:hypothetical protein